MIWLPDGNVLIALTAADLVDHDRAHRWFGARGRKFATCPITQGTLLRFYMRFSRDKSAESAWRLLDAVTASERHQFWSDDFDYGTVAHARLLGHAQVTDAYLAELARRNKGRVATMDRGSAELHGDVAELLPG